MPTDPSLSTELVRATQQASSSIEVALYVGGAAITGAFGAVWALVRRLGKRLDHAHTIHVGLLEGQVKQLIGNSKLLEDRLDDTSGALLEQQRERIEEARAQIERMTAAIVASTEATNRAEKSNQALMELVRAIHQDLRTMQEIMLHCRQVSR